ncbi:MAG: PadR family transcriptional regulator [Gemmatimonadetes bacterium]|nr:PadR family transcriptional regulator [Gemmatimonadota bacterium]
MARINLTYTTGVVLQAIADGHRYGFDIMDASGLPDGTVYPALRRLEAAGLLRAQWEDETKAARDGRPARRYYRLTAAGQRTLAAARARYPGLVAARLRPGGASS